VGETEQLGVYTLLTARLVAEIEAERLEEALPEPPAPKADPEVERVQARIDAAEARWDSGPLDAARAAMAELEAKLVEHTERQKGLKKALRTLKQKLSRTVDRRARIAEAPPAGQAEAEAAVERGQAALKAADKSVRKASRQVGASEEGVVAAKAAAKRSMNTLTKRAAENAEAQAVVEGLQTQIVAFRADDEAQLVQIRKVEKAAAQAMAQDLVDKGERLEQARARLEAIDVEEPEVQTRLGQIDLQLQANRGAFSDLSGNRDALADALVLSREAKPAQRTARKDKAAVLAQAEVKHDRLAELLVEASKVFKAAGTVLAKMERVAGKARDRRAASELKLGQTTSSLASAEALAVQLADKGKQIRAALAANKAAQAAAEAAAEASRKESCAAVERALGFARERVSDLDGRAKTMGGALSTIAERKAAHGIASKALASQRKALTKALKNAHAQRKARLSLVAKHGEQIESYGQSLSSLSSGLGPLVRASRKAGAAHAGAAARVVGARDAHGLSNRRIAEAQAGRERSVDSVGQADALVQQTRAELAALQGRIAAADAAAEAKRPPPPSEVEAILSELKPTVQGVTADALRPASTWTDEASSSDADEGATAIFSPQGLKARLQQEQQGEEVADATVMFTRDKRDPAPPVVPEAVVEPEEGDEEAATMMFSVEQLRARAKAELEEEPDDDATVIFQRPPPKDEDS
jgi:chromosome segregation ATPase